MVRPFNPMMINNARPLPVTKKKEKGPVKTPKEKLLLYTKLTLSAVLATGLTSLLFLGLIVLDPAISTLSAHFVETPVQCRVVHSQYVLGSIYIILPHRFIT